MKNRREISQDDKKKLSENARRLTMSLLVMLFVVYALIVFSVAWFNSAMFVTASGMGVNVINVSGLTYRLYEWVGTTETVGEWIEISSIDYTDGVPNEVRRYMVVSQGNFNDVEFSFTNNVVLGDNVEEESLYDYIYIGKESESPDGISIDPTTQAVTYTYPVNPTPEFFDYADKTATNDVGSNLSGNKYTLPVAAGTKTAVFDIYISKDVCNYFALWGFGCSIDIG